MLVDTSVWHRAHLPAVAERLSAVPLLYTCLPVAVEVGVGARSASEHTKLLRGLRLATTEFLPITAKIEERAIDAQCELAAKGYHRAVKLADLLIATIAHVHGVAVLHYDSDFDLIAEALGWSSEWVVERGSVD
jgi:predicted nucleic acid-binding protein